MRLNVDLKTALYDELQAHATAVGRSLSDVVRELVVRWCATQRRAAGPVAPVEANDDDLDP
jgi:negative regulator of replication initiation